MRSRSCTVRLSLSRSPRLLSSSSSSSLSLLSLLLLLLLSLGLDQLPLRFLLRQPFLLSLERSGVGLTLVLLAVAFLLLFLLDALYARVDGERDVDEGTRACVVILLPAGALGLVLFLGVSLVVSAGNWGKQSQTRLRPVASAKNKCNEPITALIHLLVEVFKAPPRIKVVPEVVEALDFRLRSIRPTKERDRRRLREPRLPCEHRLEVLEERGVGVSVLLDLLDRLGGVKVILKSLVVGIDGIELAALFGVGEDLERFLDALEELVVVRVSRVCFFVGVVLEPPFCGLGNCVRDIREGDTRILERTSYPDLVSVRLVTELGESKDSIVVLTLTQWIIGLSVIRHLMTDYFGIRSHLPLFGIARQKLGRLFLLADAQIVLRIGSKRSSPLFSKFVGLALVIIVSALLDYSSSMGEVRRTDGMESASAGGYFSRMVNRAHEID